MILREKPEFVKKKDGIFHVVWGIVGLMRQNEGKKQRVRA